MNLSPKAQSIYVRLSAKGTKLGELKKMAKEIKKDHGLAMELWSTNEFLPRMLAVLILDRKLLTQDFLKELDADMQAHGFDDRNRLMEWLMANQLMKSKHTLSMIESWENSSSALQRRTFWYHQGRLRWTGKTPPDNTDHLLNAIDARIVEEEPAVQWAMNFTAAWIGIFDEARRVRCIEIGERIGLYKEEVAPKGCTPNYLPKFIEIEVGKRTKK